MLSVAGVYFPFMSLQPRADSGWVRIILLMPFAYLSHAYIKNIHWADISHLGIANYPAFAPRRSTTVHQSCSNYLSCDAAYRNILSTKPARSINGHVSADPGLLTSDRVFQPFLGRWPCTMDVSLFYCSLPAAQI